MLIIRNADGINPIKDTECICHINLIPRKSNAYLKSHHKAHGL